MSGFHFKYNWRALKSSMISGTLPLVLGKWTVFVQHYIGFVFKFIDWKGYGASTPGFYVCINICMYASIYLSLYGILFICMYVRSIYLSIYLSISYPLSFFVHINQSIYLWYSGYMYVCMYLSIYLCIYLSIYLSHSVHIYRFWWTNNG